MDIYIPNKYTITYYRIVNRSFSEQRKRSDDTRYEAHHVIPKSIGGSDERCNIVLLTPREHYVCHRLLPKMVSSKLHYHKMMHALWCMINGNGRSKRYSPNSKTFQRIREEVSNIKSKRMTGDGNHFFGKNHSAEAKSSISKNNGSKREEVKQKLRGPRPNFMPHNHFTGWSNEMKVKLSAANLGNTHSKETKLKMSESRKGKMWIKKAGEKSKHIFPADLESYISSGWVRGR